MKTTELIELLQRENKLSRYDSHVYIRLVVNGEREQIQVYLDDDGDIIIEGKLSNVGS